MPDNHDRDNPEADTPDRAPGNEGDSGDDSAESRSAPLVEPMSDELKLEVEILAGASESPGPGDRPRESGLDEPAAQGGFAVLVVDDDPDMRGYIMRCLGTEDEIGRLVETRDGAEALALLRSGEFDVVVCDVVMPVMDGLELSRAIRADSNLDHVDVLFVTGELSSRPAREQALDAGASGILAKPFNAETLCRRVLRMLRSRGPPPE